MWLRLVGSCAICRRMGYASDFVLDYDDLTGVFRGTLCRECDQCLDLFGGSAEWLEQAATRLYQGYGRRRGRRHLETTIDRLDRAAAYLRRPLEFTSGKLGVEAVSLCPGHLGVLF